MFRFLKTDIRGQKNYEKRMHTSVDNTANGLRYEIMFQNRVNKKKNFFIKQNIAFIFETKIYFIHGDIFFKIPRDLIAPAFFFFFFFWASQILKNKDMLRQKPRMLYR